VTIGQAADEGGYHRFSGWHRQDLLLAGLAGIAYFVLAGATILLTTNDHIATVWPPNAVIVAMLIPIPPRRWLPYLLAGLIANVAANAMVYAIMAPLIYAIINIGEIVLVAALLTAWRSDVDIMSDLGSVGRFILVAGIVAPAMSAVGGAASAHFLFSEAFGPSYITWYVSDALGLLIFTPLFLALRTGGIEAWVHDLNRARRIEAVALFALVTAVASFVFARPEPMLFAVVAPVMVIAIRLGRFGTKIAVTIVALIGAIATSRGYGPISALFPNVREEAHALQLFLATLLLTALPVSAELTARRTLARKLKESEMGLRLLASGSDALLSLDIQGVCRQASDAASTLLGVGGPALVGRELATLALADDAARIETALAEAAVTRGGTSLCEFRPKLRPNRWMECAIKALADERGQFSGAIGAVRDVTERRQRELAANRAASIDSLTGALTRATFLDNLDDRLARGTGHQLALIMIDVDLFKHVNDTHGHPAGDKVLKEIVSRVRARLRDSDLIGRLGGDEFAILLDGARAEHATTAARCFADLVANEPVRLRGGIAQLMSISFGVAEATDGISREALLQQADDALIKVKRKRRTLIA